MEKKIVFGAYFNWGSHLRLGSHEYAKQFARNGYDVAYISAPISFFHLIFAKNRNVLRGKLSSWVQGGKKVDNGKIWEYVPFTSLPIQNRPILKSQWVINRSHKFTIPSLATILKKKKFDKAEIVFLDEPQGYLLDLVEHNISIYRIHDYLRPITLKNTINFQINKEKVINNVDLVIVANKKIAEEVKAIGAKRVLYLPNAVDFELFFHGSSDLPEEYKYISSPRIVYVGTINYWFDADLLEFVAKKLPQVSFVLIGKNMINLSKIVSLPNVHLLGIRNYDDLSRYLKNAMVGILPFKIIRRIEHSSPNKLFQYMACGLPVVSVKWEELEAIKSPAYLASNRNEFVQFIEKALSETNREKYIEFARRNSWVDRFNKIQREIAKFI